ncbi:MAG: D-alanine--D-alanine ligase [Lachnospiraceae bacterium]|nr:D-alanine--D-alanine ligase [Lachnospiraceae bacterium]
MKKKCVVVLFGGRSSEHEISCVSAQTVIDSIDKDKYDVVLIGITKDGRWLKVDSLEDIKSGKWKESKKSAVISPDSSRHTVLVTEDNRYKEIEIDVAFPVLHGLYGEDGTVQGLFELADIPYVGCGVIASAASMDKFYTKLIVDTLHIRQAKYVPVFSEELQDMKKVVERIEAERVYPVFVKPSQAGSSQGVSKAHNRQELIEALQIAAKHDRKILVEETIVGREIECAVLGGRDVEASGVGEILSAADFYDYDAKYNNQDSKTVIDPDVPADKVEEIRKAAVDIFKALDGFGLARVDFFLEKGTNEVVFNEINTLPGFTPISMYPMLWANKGIDKTELVDRLINLAFTR